MVDGKPRVVVFAATPIDAVNYCKDNNLVFTDVVWVMNYQLLGESGLKDVDEVHYTELFRLMPAFAEAEIKWNQDKGETV